VSLAPSEIDLEALLKERMELDFASTSQNRDQFGTIIPEILEPPANPSYELKVVPSLRARCERKQYRHTSGRVKEQKTTLALAVVNQGIAGFKARHNPLGWIELKYPTKINSKVCKTIVSKLKGERSASPGSNIFTIALTEAYDPRPGLSEYAPFLKALAGLNSKESLRDVAAVVATASSASTETTFMRKEISHCFEGNASVEVECKTSAKPWLSRAVIEVGFCN
jgi:hypothetical protein